MTTQTEALKLALEAMERYQVKRQDFERFADVITALKEALAQTEHEPVAWIRQTDITELTDCEPEEDGYTPLYAIPPQRKPLTDEQIGDIAAFFYPRWQGHEGFARAIEAAHGIKE